MKATGATNTGSISNKLQSNFTITLKAMLIKVNEWLRLLGVAL
jgi:hypothetical protein